MTQLNRLPLRTNDDHFNVIVETPRGSRVKLAFDDQTGLFLVNKHLQLGFAFPFPFGFLPSTKGDDGDPLDVLLITDLELPCGVLVHVDLLGVIKMQQRKAGADVTRNDRLLGVPALDHQDRAPRRMEDIPAAELDAIAQFFKAYQAADGVAADVVGMGGAGDVDAIIAAAT